MDACRKAQVIPPAAEYFVRIPLQNIQLKLNVGWAMGGSDMKVLAPPQSAKKKGKRLKRFREKDDHGDGIERTDIYIAMYVMCVHPTEGLTKPCQAAMKLTLLYGWIRAGSLSARAGASRSCLSQ